MDLRADRWIQLQDRSLIEENLHHEKVSLLLRGESGSKANDLPATSIASDTMAAMPETILSLLSAEHGHFLLESGYHASMWLNLETLFVTPSRIDPLAAELANRLSKHAPEAICGPLVEGAFLALFVARHLNIPFTYSERGAATGTGLYPYRYSLPAPLRSFVAHKRVAIVNDVISAGSAVGGTAADLESAGAEIVAIGALLVLGEWSRNFSASKRIALEALAESPFEIATPADCRQCKLNVPLQRRIQST